MSIYFNPLDIRCKSIIGGMKQGEKLELNVFCQKDEFSSDKFLLVINRDGEHTKYFEMTKTDFGWHITIRIHNPGLYFYRFKVGDLKIGRGAYRFADISDDSPSYQLTVYSEDYKTPDWFKGGVMYQIFPDRFYKAGEIPIAADKILRSDWGGTPYYKPNECGKVMNNDFFGGNLKGVQEKLPYLKSLGVTVIYFNPVFEAFSNHRYDTGDYMKIDSLLGSKEDFCELIDEAAKLGIKIILDGVFNHTGDDSRYFNKYGKYDELGAYQSTESKYFDWYHFIHYPELYDGWWGISTLPAVNKHSKSYRNFIFGENGVLKTWLRSGVGGYRLDVADELPDFFLKELRSSVKEENSEAIIIGEVWEDASNKIAYSRRREYLQGYELDSVMNYPLKDAIIDFVKTKNTDGLRETMGTLIDHYPKCVLDSLMNILGTHDTSRILTVLGGKECSSKDEMSVTHMTQEEKANAIESLKIAALLQFTLPGVPCIYYGDENGMEGYGDPFCRGTYDWKNRNTALTEYYRKLSDIRNNVLKDVMRDGEYSEIGRDERIYIFSRKKGIQSFYVFVNFSDRTVVLKTDGRWKELLTDLEYNHLFEIKPNDYGILIKI